MPANVEKLKVAKEVSHRSIFLCVARSAAGRVVVGTSDFKVAEIDLAAAKPEPKEIGSHASYVTGVTWAGTAVVSGSYDGRLVWWDADRKAAVRSVEAHSKWVRDVKASRDGAFVVSVADDMVGRVWDAATGKLRHELRGHSEVTPHHFVSMMYACAISPDGRHIATSDKVGRIVVWDSQSGAKVAELEAPGFYTWDPVQRRHSIGGIRSLAFSPDGTQLAVGGIGKIGNIDHLDGKARVELFDWKAGKRAWEFQSDKFNGLVNQLEYHPKGDWLVGAGGANDGLLMFLDPKAKKPLRQDKVAMHVHDIALTPDADTIVAAGHNRIIVYELKG